MTRNPFQGYTPPPPPEELRPTVVRFICKSCGERCGFDPQGVLVHADDDITVSTHGVRYNYADHTPVVELIDTTAREAE